MKFLLIIFITPSSISHIIFIVTSQDPLHSFRTPWFSFRFNIGSNQNLYAKNLGSLSEYGYFDLN